MRHFLSSRRKSVALAAAAVASLAAVGSAHAISILGLTTTNQLTTFDSASPMNGSAPIAITGLEGINQRIIGIDLRPTTGLIYGLSSDSKLYTLNATTGVATKVANLSTSLSGVSFGVDFNPVADLAGMASLRITSDNGQNLAVNVNAAGPAGTATVQTALSGGATGATSAAYSNNDIDPSTGTTLYYIDAKSDALYSTTAPAGGVLTLVGSLGIDVSGVAGFDIAGTGNSAFAALSIDGSGQSSLYSINLATGAATSQGMYGIAGNTAIAPQLLGVTVNVTPVPEPATYGLMLAGLAAVGAVARRRKG